MRKLTIRGKLYFLIFIMVVPMVILQGLRIANHYRSGIDRELEINEDYAKAISVSFGNYLDRIWDTELALGLMLKSNKSINSNEITNYMDEIAGRQPGIREYDWIDKNYVIAMSSDRKAVGVSLKGLDYLDRIAKGEEKVVSEVLISRVYNEPTFVVARAIWDNEELLGVVATTIELDKLSLVLPSGRTGEATVSGLIDNKEVIVYQNGESPVNSLTGSFLRYDAAMKKVENQSSTNHANSLETKVLNAQYANFNKEMEASVSITRINWTAYANTSYIDVITRITKNTSRDIILLTIMMAVSIISAFNISKGILEPINVLKSAAQEIEKGNLNIRTNIKGSDEIALAAQAFDRMALSIDEYDKLKNQFFSTISHELKTPLNIILASTQMINKSCSLGRRESCLVDSLRYTKIMRQNCYRLLRLINNLIDISRIDSGFMKINLSPQNIVSVVEEITLSVADYAESRDISLVFDTEIEEKIIYCDPDKIERIILNLLSNSIKFTNQGGSISVNLYERDKNIVISVKDTGIGIPKDKQRIIFERFRQVDSSLQRQYEGSGIGLSLVKALIEAHGGTISVKSENGRGSEFIIELPEGEVEGINEVSQVDYEKQSLDRVHKIDVEFSDIYAD